VRPSIRFRTRPGLSKPDSSAYGALSPVAARAKCFHKNMNRAYHIVFACPKGGHDINLQRKCVIWSLSEIEAMKIFGHEDISCESPKWGCPLG
jgi:hypothetical protein